MIINEIRNPIKAIRAHCLRCCGDNANEVKLCTITDCPLYPFRLGKNPYRARKELSTAQREHLAEMNRKSMEVRRAVKAPVEREKTDL